MSTLRGVDTFTLTRQRGFTCLIQSRCFLWSSDAVDAMEREWRENSALPATASLHSAAHGGVFLSPNRCPPSPGFGALGILELDDIRSPRA